MQTYLFRAITTFLFPLDLIAAAFLFFGQKENKRRALTVWIGGTALCYAVCVLFHWMKDLLFSYAPIQRETVEYYVTFGWFAYNYALNFGIKLLLFLIYTQLLRLAYMFNEKEAMFAACTAVAAESLARLCFEIAVVRYGPSSMYIVGVLCASASNILLYILLRVAVYLLCWSFFVRRLPKDYIGEVPSRVLHVVQAITIASIFSSCVSAPPTESEYMAHVVLQLTQFILCFTILVLEYYIVSWFNSRFEQQQLESIMKFQERHYMVTRESMDLVNMNAHDLKYKLYTIMDEIRERNDDLQGELAAIQESIRTWDAIYHTGSKALDVVLSEKAMLCNQEGIQFSVIADGECIALMTDVDIYTLFGNALDNAIEAVRKVKDEEARLISLSLHKNRGFVIFHLENSFSGDIDFKDGTPVTSKEDKAFHGFGIKSIQTVAQKYAGKVTLEAKDRLFTLDIVLQGTF